MATKIKARQLSTGNDFGGSGKQLLNYVPRTASSGSFDYVWTDGSWTNKSVQSIVGTSAVRVHLRALYSSTAGNMRVMFAKGGTFTVAGTTPDSINDARIAGFRVYFNNGVTDGTEAELVVDLDGSQQVEFFLDSFGQSIQLASVQVIGWWEPAGV